MNAIKNCAKMVLYSFSPEIHLLGHVCVLVYAYSIMMLYTIISHAVNLLEKYQYSVFANLRVTREKDVLHVQMLHSTV